MIDWQKIPSGVKVVAAMQLLIAAECIGYFVFASLRITESPALIYGFLALLKGFFFVAIC